MNFIKASFTTVSTTTTSVDPCSSNPCTQNNPPLCLSSGPTYYCLCVSGEACTNNTCQNNGICLSNMDCTNNCTCPPGFSGDSCQSKQIINEFSQIA
jgi:hypothetical protein